MTQSEVEEKVCKNTVKGLKLYAAGKKGESIPYFLKAAAKVDDLSEGPPYIVNDDVLDHQLVPLCLQDYLDRVRNKAGNATPKTRRLRRLLFGDENKHWERVLQTETVEGYIRFLLKYPQSIYAATAKGKIDVLQIGQQRLRIAISKIMHSDIQGNLRFTPTNRGYILNISAHLLKDYSPYDSDPMVKARYGSKEALYGFVKRRIAGIYRVVFTSSEIKLNEVVVECHHGVRHVIIGGPGGGDIATTIYSVSIDGKKAARIDWTNISIEQIQTMWSVRTDIIPSIQFQYGRGL